MAQTEAQRIEQAIENFILKIEHKLPTEINQVCTKALSIIQKAELLLENTTVTDFTKIVPTTEPSQQAILVILETLGKIFSSVADSLKPGLIAGAGAQISALIHNVGANPSSYLTPYLTVSGVSKV